MHLLIVEDERKIRGFLERGLTEEGHRVALAPDLASARAALAERTFDLMLVDRVLPDGDGLELVRELRRRRNPLPTVCVTARDRVEDRVEGLYGGADDYLVKAFAFDAVLARTAAVCRISAAADGLVVGDLHIDVRARPVTRAGTEIRLTTREFELLGYLAENAGRVVSRTLPHGPTASTGGRAGSRRRRCWSITW